MPRLRSTEMPHQRVSTRNQVPLRTSSSDSDPPPRRPTTDRSPKLGDRRSPRTAHSEPLNPKKLGTRIAGLETQLEKAQGELKILKNQLASTEFAKKEAQNEVENRNMKPAMVSELNEESNKEIDEEDDTPDENQKETDVFEVPIEKVEVTRLCDQDEKAKQVKIPPESPEKPRLEETLAEKNEEISSLKVKLEEKEKELEESVQENKDLKHQLTEAKLQISSAIAKEEKANMKLNQLEEEFRKRENEGVKVKNKLKEAETAKEAVEMEMKKLRVEMEQWKKAADAAAAIVAGDVENEGRRVFGSPGFWDESEDGLGTGKRKGSGIRMFGDLWKKKGQK